MRLFGKLLVLALLLAVAGPFFIRGPDGAPLLTLDELRIGPSLQELTASMTRTAARIGADGAEGAGTGTRVVRWRDADGVWQFAAQAPEGVAFEVLWIEPTPPLAAAPSAAPEAVASGRTTGSAATAPTLGESPSDLAARAAALQTDAEAIRAASEARVRELDALRAAATP